MAKFFIDESCILNGIVDIDLDTNIELADENANHIVNVLRLKIGDKVEICFNNKNNMNIDYICEIQEIKDLIELKEVKDLRYKNKVVVRVVEIIENVAEPNVKVILYQGLPKSEKMELIIQKCVELGIDTIVPICTERAIVKLNNKNNKEDKKISRWNKISEAASKQSKRGKVPEVTGVLNFKDAIAKAKLNDYNIVAYEKEEEFGLKEFCGKIKESLEIKENLESISIGVFIGPEGGFTEKEISLAYDNNVQAVTLGRRILRTETAGFITTGILIYELDEL